MQRGLRGDRKAGWPRDPSDAPERRWDSLFLRGGVGEGTISLRWGSLSGADPLSRSGCTSSSGEPLPMRRASRSDHAEFAENEPRIVEQGRISARFVLPRVSVESAGRVLAQ